MSRKSIIITISIIISAIIIAVSTGLIIINLKKEIKILSFDQTRTISFGYERAIRVRVDEVENVSFNMHNPQDFIDRKIKNHENLYEVWEMVDGRKNYILKFDDQLIDVWATSTKVMISNFGNYMNFTFSVLYPGKTERIYDGFYSWEELNKAFKEPIFNSFAELKGFYLNFGDLVEIDDENQTINMKAFRISGRDYLRVLSKKYWIKMIVYDYGVEIQNTFDFSDPSKF